MKGTPFVFQENPIPFTAEGYTVVLNQLQTLLNDRPAAVEQLKKAREMGDLSENGYYKAARARLSFLDKRIREYTRLKKLGKVVAKTITDTVQIGSLVTLTDGKQSYTYTIVGGYESDPSKQTISHLSPIGKSIIGKRINDSVTVVAPKKNLTFKNRVN
jgi:transcription elongation factor GreA